MAIKNVTNLKPARSLVAETMSNYGGIRPDFLNVPAELRDWATLVLADKEAGKIHLFNDDDEPESYPASAPCAEPDSTCRSTRSMALKSKITIATRLKELMEEARQLNENICTTRARLERKRAKGIEIEFLGSDKEERANGAGACLKDDNDDSDGNDETVGEQKIEEDIGGDWDSSDWVDDGTFVNCTKVRCYFNGMPEELLESYKPESSDDDDSISSESDEAVWCD